jgi:hypothetical protein
MTETVGRTRFRVTPLRNTAETRQCRPTDTTRSLRDSHNCGASGCCLAFDGNEKFYQPVAWMKYLIQHFLKPGAEASKSGHEQFSGFTFDHRLDGLIIGCRRDNKELFAIEVSDNRVTERILRPADQRYVDSSPLPYEDAIDRDQPSRRRRRRARSSGNVVELRREG